MNVFIGPSPQFGLSANETINVGWSLTFCYECIVSPIGDLTPIAFKKDNISLSAVPSFKFRDCSKALTPKHVIIPHISYGSTTEYY